MTEKRFLLDKLEKGNAILSVKITDSVSDDDYFIMTKEAYEDDIYDIVCLLNEQDKQIKELIDLIIDKVQYHEDHLEEFLIKKGIIDKDWARFDDYD